METAVRRAVGWHPTINEASDRIYQADERIRAAQAGYYPKLNAGVNSGYQSNNREGWRPQFNVAASQLLYDFGKVSSAVDTERAGKEINQARMLLAVDNLSRDTASAVVEVQRYRKLSALAQEQVEGVKRIAGLVNERTDKGASTMSDKVQADARVEAAMATQFQYQSELNRWQVVLAAMIGGGSANPSSDVPSWLGKSCDIAAPDWDQVPAMLQAKAEKEEAVAQLAASKAEAFPTVSLEA
ncbi:outer membrane efflux family protein, partial [Brucella pseudogrignonensis]